ncbi:MAG: pyridoxal-phosphate dependent enzyme [Geodermatophilaceae bacterium]
MRALWVKDDSANPTHSFKDRVVSMAATAARGFGYDRLACASTGNLANSVAAHAARAGMSSMVFIPADLEPGKIVQSAIYGGTLVAVEGSYDDVNRLTSELAETDEFESTAFVQPERAAVLRRGLQDGGLRDRRAAGLAAARAGRRTGGLRLAADQDRQGVHGVGRGRAGGCRARGGSSVRSPSGCSPISCRLRRRAMTWFSRCGPPGSRSR